MRPQLQPLEPYFFEAWRGRAQRGKLTRDRGSYKPNLAKLENGACGVLGVCEMPSDEKETKDSPLPRITVDLGKCGPLSPHSRLVY